MEPQTASLTDRLDRAEADIRVLQQAYTTGNVPVYGRPTPSDSSAPSDLSDSRLTISPPAATD